MASVATETPAESAVVVAMKSKLTKKFEPKFLSVKDVSVS